MTKLEFTETEETRPPMAGEWFRNCRGIPEIAMFDFSCQSLAILQLSIKEEIANGTD